MERFFNLVGKYKWWVIAACLSLTLFLAYGLGKLEIRSVLEGELPDNDQIVQTNNEFKQVFGDKSYVVFAVVNENGLLNSASLVKLKEFSQALRSFPGINKEQILSLATFTQVENSADGLLIEPLLSTVPQTSQELQRLEQVLRSNSLIWQRLISADLTTTLIQAPVDKTTPEHEVYQVANDLIAQYQGPEKIFVYSFQVIDEAIDAGINHDLSILFPLAIAVICLLFFFCFANLRSVFLPLIAMLLAVVSTMGAMGWLGYKVSTVTSIIPVMIIALGSSYGIHLLERYFSVSPQQRNQALSLVVKPIALAGLTSAIGFGTLAVFKIISLREFGLFAALGIIFMLIYILIFCPALLAVLPPTQKPGKGLGFFEQLTESCLVGIKKIIQHPRLVWLVSGILLVLALVGMSQLQVGSNPTKFFPADHPVRLTSELFDREFKGTGVIEVMFECQTTDCVLQPQNLEQIWQFQKYAAGLPSVGYTDSIIDALIYINKTLNQQESVPRSFALVSQYLLLYAMDTTVDLGTYLDGSHQKLKVTIWMNIDDSQVIEQNYEQMKNYLATNFPPELTAKFGGENMEWISQNKYIVTGKIVNIICSIIIIWLVCALVFRSWRLGVLAIAPLTYSTILVFGLMGWLGIRLDLASCILTSVTVGVGVDFSIHYLNRLLEKKPDKRFLQEMISLTNYQAGKPILFDALSNILGFTVLLFSSFTPIRDFGWLIVLTMVVCSVGTLVFLPLLTPILGKFSEEEINER